MAHGRAPDSEIVTLARQQRHASLLAKMKTGDALTRAELRELETFEAETPAPPPPGKRRGNFSLVALRVLAMESENLAAAAVAYRGPGRLEDLLKKRPNARKAWQRGRLLRSVRQLARTSDTVTQAGKDLGLTGPEFRQLLDTDAEVRDVWDQERRILRGKMTEAMVANAEAGRASAIKYVETYLRGERAPAAGFDYEHVPTNVLAQILGKERHTILAWSREGGLPRNADGTYDLAAFFPWYKASLKTGTKYGSREDRLRAVHASLKELDLQKARGDLLERTTIENGLVARLQNLLAAVENHVGATAAACVDQPVDEIERRIRAFCGQLRVALHEIPSELKLPADQAAAFKEFLGRLGPPATDKGTKS